STACSDEMSPRPTTSHIWASLEESSLDPRASIVDCLPWRLNVITERHVHLFQSRLEYVFSPEEIVVRAADMNADGIGRIVDAPIVNMYSQTPCKIVRFPDV